MNSLRTLIVVGLSAIAASLGHTQTTISFDDLSGTIGTPIANGYSGLNWSHFYTINAAQTAVTDSRYATNGYAYGTISGSNVAYYSGGNTAAISSADGTPFDVVSGYFTAAWLDGLKLTVDTFLTDGSFVSTNVYTLSTTKPTLLQFGFTGIGRIAFDTGGNYGYQFAMDDLTVKTGVIPEPSTYCMILGLAALGLAVCRRLWK
jgi:hypothetical protein